MKKFSYFSPDNACHYLYLDGKGNAAYERYSIEEEQQTDHLNNLSDEEMEQWLCDAYDAEEEQMESEEAFVDKFLEHFDVHETADDAVEAEATADVKLPIPGGHAGFGNNQRNS